MSLKLDELRKRLLQNQSPDEAPAESIHYAASHSAAAGGPEAAETEPATAKPGGALIIRSAEGKADTIESGPSGPPRVETIFSSRADRLSSFREDAKEPLLPVRRAAAPKSEPSAQMADTVAKLFDQTATFKARFDEMSHTLDKLERISSDTSRVLEPLRSFHRQLAQLAASFEPMRTFQSHLAQLSDSFEPMKALHEQLSQLADSFQQNVAQLVKALEPARDFRDRMMKVAHSLDEAITLQADFGELYDAFRKSEETAQRLSGSSGAPAGGSQGSA